LIFRSGCHEDTLRSHTLLLAHRRGLRIHFGRPKGSLRLTVEHPSLQDFRTVTFICWNAQGGQAPAFEDLRTISVTFHRIPHAGRRAAGRFIRSSLAKRLQSTGTQRVVIGISGGLDSTHALLVCAQCMDLLGYPRSNMLAYTMPGFATSRRTLEQGRRLMQAVGCEVHEIDIRPQLRADAAGYRARLRRRKAPVRRHI
jgi:hypothetical protein